MGISLSQEECIRRFKTMHLNRYDYSLVVYKSSIIKVDIICKDHGVFSQSPDNHYKGKGCPKCGVIKNSKSRAKTHASFIEECIKVHNNKYDYSLSKYVNDKEKVIVSCRVHGDFLITPNNHQKGKGCKECGKITSSLKTTHTTELFIKKATLRHGNKYDYSKVNYIRNNIHVDIICSKHGVFKQKPTDHLNNGGCIKCSNYNRRITKQLNPTGWSDTNWQTSANKSKRFDSFKVYIIKCWNDTELFYKVGKTFTTVKERFRSTNIPYKYEIVKEFIFDNAKEATDKETELKRINIEYRYKPNIIFYGRHECFSKIIA